MAWNDFALLSDVGLQMGTSIAYIYSAPVDKDVEVYSINLWNSDTSTATAEMFVYGSTSAYEFFKEDLGANIHREFYQNAPICLFDGDSIYAKSTTSGKINVRIYGREEA